MVDFHFPCTLQCSSVYYGNGIQSPKFSVIDQAIYGQINKNNSKIS